MLDQDGKLFGRLNIIDFSFVIITSAMVFGLFWVAMGNSPLQQEIISTGPVEVTVAVRGARVLDPTIFKVGEKAFLTIRNSRYKAVEVVKIETKPRYITLMGTDNKPVSIADPSRPEVKDIDLTFKEQAEVLKDGVTMGGYKLKVGNTVELDAFGYRFRGSIMKVDMPGK